ncbi:MAG: CU044_2847 family protein [Bacteroidota bacterium]
MPRNLLSYPGDQDTDILVELIDEEDNYEAYRGAAEVITKKAKKSFNDTLDSLKLITEQVVGKLKEVRDSPDEVTLQLGVKITAEADIVLAKVNGATHMNLTLKWKKAPEKEAKPAVLPGSPPLAGE